MKVIHTSLVLCQGFRLGLKGASRGFKQWGLGSKCSSIINKRYLWGQMIAEPIFL